MYHHTRGAELGHAVSIGTESARTGVSDGRCHWAYPGSVGGVQGTEGEEFDAAFTAVEKESRRGRISREAKVYEV